MLTGNKRCGNCPACAYVADAITNKWEPKLTPDALLAINPCQTHK